MAVAGLPQPWPDHAAWTARMALAMRDVAARLSGALHCTEATAMLLRESFNCSRVAR